jgi:2-polyprenyl-6-methoxyphenol hydroxylase-like FAD-dependent oxidoreductase
MAEQRAFGGREAVVVGGGIAGLVAAGALAAHFERVTLVERDEEPGEPAPRKGAPQARHVHVLLKRGERVVERIFPGLFAELRAAGGQRVDTAGDARWLYWGGWKARFRSGFEMISQTRPLLEWMLGQRLRALRSVRRLRADATGLRVSEGRVQGLGLGRRPPGIPPELDAQLVVDASGRGSRLPVWLEQAGYSAPETSEVRVDVGYASRLYRRTGAARDWTALLCHPRFPDKRCGVLLPVEQERWLLTLVGWFGDHPPGDEEGFLRFAASLATHELHDAVKDAEPVSPIAVHKLPSNLRRHYERIALPEGVAVVGDAASSFNPVYAQGMATAAWAVDELDACLREQAAHREPGTIDGLTRRYHRRLARVIDGPWQIATTEDFRSREAVGKRPLWSPLLQWYTARVHELTWSDPFAALRFLEVMHLVRSPLSLFDPRIAARALLPRRGDAAPLARSEQRAR